MEELTASACEMALHRRSDTLEAKDVAFCLSACASASASVCAPWFGAAHRRSAACLFCVRRTEKYWNTEVPGFAPGDAAKGEGGQ